jgi:protein tyrosine/serine phosphatase
MRFVNIPVLGWSAPNDVQVAQFLKLVQQDPAQKIFVHCYYGEDRTGVMVATYRIAQQNWTPEQAAAEMDSFGFHYHLYAAMKSYVRRFPVKLAADPVFASLRTAPAQR